ncbi:reverse transcriptase domain-containing protein [Tanacetum coccineum]
MEELCQPTMYGRGRPIAPVNIQAIDFGLKNHMIQQVQNSFQFHELLGDDANKHLDKFLTITQNHATSWFDRLLKNSIHTFQEIASKFLSKYFPPSMVMKLRNDISNSWQFLDESLFKAWERYKLLIDRCPNHNMLPVTQIDTFYNGLTLRRHDTINDAAGGTFMKRRPEECFDLIKNMTTHHNDWDTSAQRGESSSSTTFSSFETAALAQQMIEMRKDMLKMYHSNQQVNSVTPNYETCGGPHSYYEFQATGGYTPDVYATTGKYNSGDSSHNNQMEEVRKVLQERPQGGLPSNTIPNPQEYIKVITTQSGITSSKLPPSPSTSSVIPKQNPHQPPIPYPSRLNKEKLQENIQIHNLLTNKEKLLELVNTPLNENCSAVFLKKLPEKLGDTERFLIPLLLELTLTRMTLELATRTVAYPTSIAEDVFVQVGKFTFPADFIIIDYEVDPHVPLILGRPFLRTAGALVDVHSEELTLRVVDEKLVFKVESTSKYPRKHGDESIHKIDILDITCEDHFLEVLNVKKLIHPLSGSLTPSSNLVVASLSPSLTPFGDSDFLLEETDAFLSLDDSIPSAIDNGIYDSEGDILFLEELLSDDPIPDLPPPIPLFEIKETKKIKSYWELYLS